MRLAVALAVVLILCGLSACSREASRDSFVGKWKSSRATTPIYLHDNGDWEIKQDDGTILQYGVWQLKDGSILWSFKIGGSVGHDRNSILSVKPREFKLREADGSTTTFTRLD